jgi:hypothetical protein
MTTAPRQANLSDAFSWRILSPNSFAGVAVLGEEGVSQLANVQPVVKRVYRDFLFFFFLSSFFLLTFFFLSSFFLLSFFFLSSYFLLSFFFLSSLFLHSSFIRFFLHSFFIRFFLHSFFIRFFLHSSFFLSFFFRCILFFVFLLLSSLFVHSNCFFRLFSVRLFPRHVSVDLFSISSFALKPILIFGLE